MLAGLVVSAVTGGLAGLAYQIGGMMSVLGFIAMAQPAQVRRS